MNQTKLNREKKEREACSTIELEAREKVAQKMIMEMSSDPTILDVITPDDEIRAVIEFYEHRTSAIAKYKNETFVDSATEALKKRFAKRMVNGNLDEHLRLVYEDMYKDVEATIKEKRVYYKQRITTEK